MALHARWILFLTLVAGNALNPAAAEEWQIVQDSSFVRFFGVQEGSAFRGRFENFIAMIDFDPQDPTAGKIVGVVKMDSGKTGDAERDATLLEADWFNPDQFPESRFESERIEPLDDGTFAAHGQLTLIGNSNPVTMIFEFEESGDTAKFSGDFDILRLDFKVGWDSTNWIDDEVGVQVALDLRK